MFYNFSFFTSNLLIKVTLILLIESQFVLYIKFHIASLVGWFTPPLPWDGGMARTAIQVHAINLFELG